MIYVSHSNNTTNFFLLPLNFIIRKNILEIKETYLVSPIINTQMNLNLFREYFILNVMKFTNLFINIVLFHNK